MVPQHPQTSSHTLGRQAVVMGGSIAGLLAARVLADHFEMVTLVERDRFPDGSDHRKGVPQGQHAHALLAKGLMVVMQFFPDLGAALAAGGAAMLDPANDMLWYAAGGYRVRYPSGLVAPFMSRPFLESLIRSRVLARSNLTYIQGCDVRGLVASDDRTRITGVRIQCRTEGAGEESLMADLIVDAIGRGSRSPKWLEELGYARPEETVIKIDSGYTSRIYRRTPADLPGAKAALIFPTPPREKRLGLLSRSRATAGSSRWEDGLEITRRRTRRAIWGSHAAFRRPISTTSSPAPNR
jgi:2-polyprenyl-6-methoxyphenol hydroxylase-like FAD-dependent oxidoreductase